MIKRKFGPRSLAGSKKSPKGKRGKIKALWAIYGLSVPYYRRYSGRKGIYWYLFSRFVRKRDYEKYGGACMTCDMYVEKGSDQCGHLFAARDCGFNLLFHPLNNHLQHSKCNNPRFTPSAGVHNAINITKRYGVDIMEDLAALKRVKGKEWSQKEYDNQIKSLLNKEAAITVAS